MAPSAFAISISTPMTSRVRHAAMVVVGYALFFTLFFSPVLFSTRVLAPGDGISYFLPSYYARSAFWDASLWGGFPSVADAPRMFWYPLAMLLSLMPNSWDLFILSAYILASSFTYGYVYNLTRSRFSAAVSGLTYGLCGFMIAHIGHAALVHTIAWLPLVVWSLRELGTRRQISGAWFACGAMGIGCAALAGHPQMFVSTLLVSGAYLLATGWTAAAGRTRYYLASSLMLGLGTSLAAVQLVPTAELAQLSLRASLTFSDFVAYELPLRQVPMLVFPFLYGGAPESFYRLPYFGAWPSSADGWGAIELTGYVGLLPGVLACVGVATDRRRSLVWFWTGAVLLAFVLALGEATPLSRFTFYIPILNKFRAPARYLFALAFGVSVLAGLGACAIAQMKTTSRRVGQMIGIVAVAVIGCWFVLRIFSGKIDELALQRVGHTILLSPFSNPALGVPLLIFIAGAGTLTYWQRQADSRLRKTLLLVVLVADLASVGWFYEWRYRSPPAAFLRAPAEAEVYRKKLEEMHQRLLPIRGGLGKVSELPPNLSKLWDIPSASGYGPLILAHTSRLLTMPPHGTVDESWRDPVNQSLDLMSVRYVLVPPSQLEPPSNKDEGGLRWSTTDFGYTIGPGCDPKSPLTLRINLPNPIRATSLALVGALACAVELPDGQEFAHLTTLDTSGLTRTYSLVAGRDFSEWAYDCADVKPMMRHRRATVFSSYSAQRGSGTCNGHYYVTVLSTANAQPITSISLKWIGPPGSFALRKVTAIDDEAQVSTPIHLVEGSLYDTSRWRHVGEISAENSGYGRGTNPQDVGTAVVYENLRARPRAWLAPEVLRVSEEEALTAVHSSRLPDGRVFDASRTGLIQEPLLSGFPVQEPTEPENSLARVRVLTDNLMELETTSSAPALLVTSDTFYPGWRATIDGSPTHIYRADYALRAVAVTAGSHVVRFEFRPRSLYKGLAISATSLVLLIGLSLWWKRSVS